MKFTRELALTALMCFATAVANAAPITATLRLKAKVPMEKLARNVLTPGSPRYGKFYEPEEIRELAAPSEAQYAELLRQLTSEGFELVNESPTHLWITVRAEKTKYESMFNTQVLGTPQIPGRVSLIDAVTGLDGNTRRAHPRFIVQSRSKSQPRALRPSAIKRAYGIAPLHAQGLTGEGVDIAIATYENFRLDNIQLYYDMSHISPKPSVDVVLFNGTPNYHEESAGETELDAELMGVIAPGARIHIFPSATNDDVGEVQMYTAILDDNRAKIVNYSWGNCETQLSPQHKAEMNEIFYRALAQGVNIFVASGDYGSDSCNNKTVAADWPAAHPAVIAVGGTTLSLSAGEPVETAWRSSGGGISAIWELPLWQQSLGTPFVRRSYPDVAFNADPHSGQAIFTGPKGKTEWMVVGGTSMASPQWAGFLALVAQARRAKGLSGLGFLNPILYAMDTATRASTFNDVRSGKNGAYKSTTGWDAVTGWGSMQGDNLLAYLIRL